MLDKFLLKRGIDKACDIVSSTAGKYGKTILYNSKAGTIETKDGFSVAGFIKFKNQTMNAGANLVWQGLQAQAFKCGDGTTATATLIKAFCSENLSLERILFLDILIANLSRQIKHLGEKYTDYDLFASRIAANNQNWIADPICQAIRQAGDDGVYITEYSYEQGINVRQETGFSFNSGYLDELFLTHNGRCELESPIVFSQVNYGFNDIQEIAQLVLDKNKSLLLVGTPDDQALKTILYYKKNAGMKVCCVDGIGIGLEKEQFIADVNAIAKNPISKIIVKKDNTIIMYDGDMKEYVDMLETEFKTKEEKEKFKERKARLLGKITKIRVGDNTASGFRKLTDQIDDVIKSTLSARKYGVVKGGGNCLYELSKSVDNFFLKKVLKAPYKNLNKNRILNIDQTICDSAEVISSALEIAWKVAKTYHNNSYVLNDISKG